MDNHLQPLVRMVTSVQEDLVKLLIALKAIFAFRAQQNQLNVLVVLIVVQLPVSVLNVHKDTIAQKVLQLQFSAQQDSSVRLTQVTLLFALQAISVLKAQILQLYAP